MAVVLLLLLLMRTGVAECCDVDTGVDITEAERSEDDTIADNGTRYTRDTYYGASDNKTRDCDCRIVNCYRKCCERTQIYHVGRCSCLDRSAIDLTSVQNDTMYKYFEEFEKLEEHGLRQVNGFEGLSGCNNDSHLFRTDSYKSHRLIKEGVLVVESDEAPDQEIGIDRYCIDVMLYVNEKTGEMTLGREAYFRGEVYEDVQQYTQSYIATIISAVFILLTIAEHLMLLNSKKLNQYIQFCHLCSWFVSLVCIAVIQINVTFSTPSKILCTVFSIITCLSLLTASFWLNVLCFETWKAFRYIRVNMAFDFWQSFGRYCIYAFGLPLLLTVLLAVWQFSSIFNHFSFSKTHKPVCFLSGKLKYLYVPVTVICITNMMLFVLTTINIIMTDKKNKKHLNNGSKNQNNKVKKSLLRYMKLSILMDVTWILDVMSFVFPKADWLWKVSNALNVLGALFIFIIEVCNKERISIVKSRFQKIFNNCCIKNHATTINTDNISQNVTTNPENLEQLKYNNEEMSISETKQNSNNYSVKSGTSITQMNNTN